MHQLSTLVFGTAAFLLLFQWRAQRSGGRGRRNISLATAFGLLLLAPAAFAQPT